MDEIDKSVFKIPGLERLQRLDFVVAEKNMTPSKIVVPKRDNLYEELTAISEEILECRSRILDTY